MLLHAGVAAERAKVRARLLRASEPSNPSREDATLDQDLAWSDRDLVVTCLSLVRGRSPEWLQTRLRPNRNGWVRLAPSARTRYG